MAENIKVVVKVDKKELSGLQSEIEKIKDKSVQIKVETTGQGAAQLREVNEIVQRLNANPVTIRVDLTGLDDAERRINNILRNVRPSLQIDTRSLERANEEVTRLVNRFDEQGRLNQSIQTANRGLAVQEQTIQNINAETGEVERTTSRLTADYKKVNQAAVELYHSHDNISNAMRNYVTSIRENPLTLQGPATPEAIARNQALTEAIDSVGLSYKNAEVSARAFAGGLTETERALNNADMATARNVQANGELIDSQEVWRDGSLIKSVDTYRDAIGNVTKVTTELNGTQARTTITTRQNSEAMRRQADAAENAARKNSLLGDSLERIIAKIFAWQTINAAVATVIRSFKNAIETMKEVDSALVTIRKVTDLTESQIESLTNKTYELATAYGRTADELLDLSATFARAGFSDNLEQMTELAALLENVGDIEGETASKFLLAANAAWQLGGDYESLMRIIDGMNEVTNQAAVDMEALTNGITVAGSVFANAGETAQTYTAMVGTAVAATQRSGNEIARGLRTIAMNVRSIKGELEDGEIIDEESISKAAAALDSVGIHVADANGELRLTSDVLADLAHQWDTLTTAEQAYLAESLAGKRQANILTALMQNWGEVERQMQLYAEGAGSAMRENELYLDSWEAKTKILSAAWTEFISHLIETEQVKGILDGLAAVVNALDSNVGRFVITVLALATAFTAVSKVIAKIGLKSFASGILVVIDLIQARIAGMISTTEIFTTVWAASPFMLAAAAAAAIYGAVKAFDALTVSTKEAADGMRDASNAYDEAMNSVDALNEKLRQNIDLIVDASIAGKDDSYKQTLMEENELLREQIEEQLTLAEVRKREAADNAAVVAERAMGQEQIVQSPMGPAYVNPGPTTEDVETWIEAKEILEDYIDTLESRGVPVAQKYYDALANVTEQLAVYKQTQMEGDEAIRTVVESYDLLYEALEELASKGEVSSETMHDLTNTFRNYAPELKKASGNSADLAKVLLGLANLLVGGQEAADGATSAFERMAIALDSSSDPAEWLAAMMNEDVTAFSNEADAATNAALQTEFFSLKAAMASGQPIDTSSAISSLSGLEGQSYNTAAALIALINVFGQIGALDAKIASASETASNAVGLRGKAAASIVAGLEAQRGNIDVAAMFIAEYNKAVAGMPKGSYGGSNTGSKTGGGGGGGKKGGSGGGGGSSEDPVLEAHKNLISLLEAELDLMEERGDSVDVQVEQIDKIQAALHDEAEYLRTIGGHEEDIVKLSAQWWKYEKEKAKLKEQELSMLKAELGLMQERGDSAEDQIEKMRAIQVALHEQADRLRGIQENSEDIVKLSEEWWKYENDIVKLKREELELTTDLHKSERELMKARGDDRQAYIAKQRQIQDDLHQQAEYLRTTKAYLDGDKETLAEINALSTEWWEIENDINDVLAEITDELADAATELVDAAEKEAKSALEAQLTLLKEQKEARKEAREEEEKLLAVEKARIALENAQKERNIRQYNASTGQWEWVANAKTVEAARESLEKAERDLADFYLDKAIDSLEKNIEVIEKGYSELRLAITSFADEVKSGTADLTNAFDYLIDKVKAAGINVSGISGLEAAATAAGGSFSSGGTPVAQKTGTTLGEKTFGIDFRKKSGTVAKDSGGSGTKKYSLSDLHARVNGTYSSSDTSPSRGKVSPASAFDSGGILRGVGGIKATYADEMVLPPDATAGLLNAERNGSFDALLSHLGIVTSAANSVAGFGSITNRNSIGSQHNGDVYEFNGVTIGEAQAKSTTIYDFAQMAKLLALRNGA